MSSIYKSSFEYFFQYKDGRERTVLTFHSAIAGIEKKIFNHFGGFDENISFKLAYENEEFGRRLSKSYKMQLIPKLKVKHDNGSFIKIFKASVSRTKSWVFYNFFINKTKNKFDKNSTTNIGMAFNIINTIFIILSFFLFLFISNKYFLYFFLIFITLNLYSFKNYYLFLFKKFQSKVILLVFLNIIFCTAVGLGAFIGIFKIILNKIKLFGAPARS